MNLLRFGSVLHNPRSIILIAGLSFLLWCGDIAFGSSDLTSDIEMMLGVQNQASQAAEGVLAAYSITDELNGPAEVTLFVSEAVASDGDIRLAISGDDSQSIYVDGQPGQLIQDLAKAGIIEKIEPPYQIWDLGNAVANKSLDWKYAFVYNGATYYGRTVHVSGNPANNKVWAFADSDNDYHYSFGEPATMVVSEGSAIGNPFAHHGRLVITDDGAVVFTKIYNGNNDENEVITAGDQPYLKINNVTVQPLADPDEDLVIQLCGGDQTWTLLKEYTPWVDVNQFGYYTDLGVGDDTTKIFLGPDDEGYTFYTSLPATTIGLWLFNDTDGDNILDPSDSYLFSQRSLTYNSGANEHQWFMVYDVSAYKGTGATYHFYTPTEDFTTTGDYNYLLYIDDDHTSSNFDHNDMILGINCPNPNTPPIATCPGDQDLFVCDLSEICIDGFECYDADGDLQSCTVSLGTLNSGTVCFTPTGSGDYTIQLVATDSQGAADTCETVVSVAVNSPPVAHCPWGARCDTTMFVCDLSDITISGFSCSDPDDNLATCQVNNGTLSGGDVTFTPVVGHNYIILTATDECGAAAACTVDVAIELNQPPQITCPPNLTIGCDESTDPAHTGTATATDDHGPAPALTYSDVEAAGSCPQEKVITRTWTATDECGATDQCDQTITVIDDEAPVITCPGNITVDCNDSTEPASTGFATATDNCDPSPVVTHSDIQVDNVITRTWTATDACGNSAQCQQTITIDDTTPPSITCPDDIFVQCADDVPPPDIGSVTAADDCDPNPTIIHVSDVSDGNSCPEVITRTYRATDANGNFNECSQTITIDDTIAPVITCPADIAVDCNDPTDPAHAGNATATDNCGGSIDIIYSDSQVGNVITRTWVATDDCGNVDQCQQTITIIDDTPPSISCPDDIFVQCSGDVPAADIGSVSAADNCDPNPTIVHMGDISDGNSCPEVITRTYRATDANGNFTECEQLITIDDTIAPTITCPADMIVACGESTDPSHTGFATATDNCDPTPVVTHTDQRQVEVIVRTWVATDACGNSSQCVQTITVEDDVDPIITCPGDLAVECDESTDPSSTGFATATDDCDPNPAIGYADVELEGDCPQEKVITRTWTATDASGNSSQCIQTITVEDTTDPVVVCPGDLTIECDESTDPAHTGTATATDNCDGAPVVSYSDFETTGACAQEKTITRTWTATDACGNSSQCDQVITVEDNTAPTISCPADIVIDCNDPTEPASTGFASATDNCDGSVDIIYSDNQVDNVITRTWVATDDCGNLDQCQQTITIIDDAPPSITCPDDIFVQCSNDVPPPDIGSVTVADDCDPVPVVIHVGDVSDGGSCPEVITRTYRATDASGNFNECEQLITIDDTIDPIITCPADIAVACGESTDPSHTGYATATDNCDPAPVVTHTDQRQLEVIIRTWVATDACGNTAQCDQTITVEDDVDPTITCPPDLTIECDESTDPANTGSASATDDCDADPAITYSDAETEGDCPQEKVITRTWTATDESGNSAQCVQTITVEDTTDPVFATCPGNLTVECDQSTEPANTGMATATDNCDPNPVVTYSDDVVEGSCPQEMTITRTWTATDACGNSAQCVQVISVEDTTDPIVTCPADMVVDCNGSTDPSATGQATATDNCDDSPVITYSDNQTGSVITRTWVATDACGNSGECVQLITLAENNPPVADCPGDNTIQVADFSELCLSGFGWSDPDGNLATVVVEANGNPADTATGGQVCFIPVNGINTITLTVTDECGEIDECTTVLNIVINTCPELVFPNFNDTSMCIFENFCDTIEVIDPDGNYIDMSAEYGHYTPIIDEPGHWLGLYCFTVPDSACGESYTYDVHVEASDGICAPGPSIHYEITVLGEVDYSMDEEVLVIPGYTGEVGLYLDTHDCLCVGGLIASVNWDPSVLNLISVAPTANLDFGQEYHNINIGAFGEGTVKLTYIADVNNQQDHGPLCEIDPNEPIFMFEFEVIPGEYPVDFVIPICYENEDNIYDNAVTDSSGYHVWYGDGCSDAPDSSQFGTLKLNFHCGSIRIINECDLLVGDVNFNRFAFEIGDVIVLANHLIDPDGNPFNTAQMWASDVNADSARATIADLIYMINVINGFQYNPKVGPMDGEHPVEFIIDQDKPGQAKLILDSDFDIGGFVIDLPIPDGVDYRLSFNNDLGMDFRTYESPGLLRVGAYSMTSNRIAAGETRILTIELPGQNISIKPEAVSVSDASGNLAAALTRQVVPLPEQFGITSCYPNPFNPTVNIEFALPTAAQVSLDIYDLAGRLVKEVAAGQFEAGYHQAIWNGENDTGEKVSSGIYFAKLNTFGDHSTTSIQKLVLLK